MRTSLHLIGETPWQIKSHRSQRFIYRLSQGQRTFRRKYEQRCTSCQNSLAPNAPPVEGYTSVVEWIDCNFENFEQHVQITTLCTSLAYTSGSRVLQCLYRSIHVHPPGRPWQSNPSILSDTLRKAHLGSVYRPTPTGCPPTTPSIG